MAMATGAAQPKSAALAVLRTRAALDRTLLAWVRTSFALQGFGFTLATYVAKWIETGVLRNVRSELPRNLGLALLTAGVLAVIGGSIEHRRAMLRLTDVEEGPRWSFASVLAFVMIAVGLLVLFALIAKL
jgi:putative membrane protein